jgi:hypothetical protein
LLRERVLAYATQPETIGRQGNGIKKDIQVEQTWIDHGSPIC